MTPGTITAARHHQVPATRPVIAPANEAPKHQVARLMLITRPRRCAGQVSATSIDPSDHSPLSAKVSSARAATKTAKLGASATRGIISENIVDCEQGAAAEPVGKPRPKIKPGDA